MLRVLPGGALAGREIAALQYTNTGSATCVLTGYPAVTLLRNGKQVGQPSNPASDDARAITLRPGDTGESRLTDFSSCQAPLSDSARVTVPGTSKSELRPLILRACKLVVGPLGPPQ